MKWEQKLNLKIQRRYFKIDGAENKFTVLSPSSNRHDENRYFSRPRLYTPGVMIAFCSDDRKAADRFRSSDRSSGARVNNIV